MTIERINSNRMRWTTVVGLVLVPVLLVGGLLLASWNTDARLRSVQAAIVNLDEPVTIDGTYIPLGRQLTANLVDSAREQNLDWVMDDAAGAAEGLASGRYAAAVTIPENFSAAATSYSDADDPSAAERATIGIETSPVAGLADATLGKVVAAAAAQALNQTLTSTYLENVYLSFGESAEQYVTLADGSDTLADGIGELSDGITQAADGAAQLSGGAEELSNGLATMAEETSSLPSGARKLADGAADLADGTAQYVDGVNALVDQTLDSLDSQAELVDGVATLNTYSGQLSAGLSTYQTGLDQQADDLLGMASDVQGGEVSYTSACPDLASLDTATGTVACVASLKAAAGALSGAAGNLTPGLIPLAQGLDGGLSGLHDQLQSSTGGEDPSEDLKTLKSAGRKLAAGTSDLADGADQLADGLPALVKGIGQAADGASQLSDGVTQLATGLDDAADGSSRLHEGAREMADGIAEGKDKIPTYTEAERTNLSEVVSEPVATGSLQGITEPNLGWASLLMVLATWLGALATYLVIKAVNSKVLASSKSSTRLVIEALAPGMAVVGIQAMVVTGVGQLALDMPLPKLLAVAALMLLGGATFVVVNHALAAWWGGVGRLVSIGFAVLSAASALTSAGPALFDTLRGFSPITPALDAIRAVLTDSAAAAPNVFALLGWLLVGVAASSVAIIRARTITTAQLIPD